MGPYYGEVNNADDTWYYRENEMSEIQNQLADLQILHNECQNSSDLTEEMKVDIDALNTEIARVQAELDACLRGLPENMQANEEPVELPPSSDDGIQSEENKHEDIDAGNNNGNSTENDEGSDDGDHNNQFPDNIPDSIRTLLETRNTATQKLLALISDRKKNKPGGAGGGRGGAGCFTV